MQLEQLVFLEQLEQELRRLKPIRLGIVRSKAQPGSCRQLLQHRRQRWHRGSWPFNIENHLGQQSLFFQLMEHYRMESSHLVGLVFLLDPQLQQKELLKQH